MLILLKDLIARIVNIFKPKSTPTVIGPQSPPQPVQTALVQSLATNPGIPGSLQWYGFMFDEAEIVTDPNKRDILARYCEEIEKNEAQYKSVERLTNVPWQLIACLHCRESSLNFRTYLGNGDPLDRVTTHVPAGRGPFASWSMGAVDALRFDGLAGISSWTVPLMLQMAEKYNGTGYLKHHFNSTLSPYIWSFTSLYQKGKYGSDGVFDPNLVDQQPGVAALLKELQLRGTI